MTELMQSFRMYKKEKARMKSNFIQKKKSRGGDGSDDDSVYNDNASVISQTSDGSYLKDDVFGGGFNNEDASGGGSEELGQDEQFEEKLKEAMEMATQKSANGRVNALEGLCKAFSKKYVPDFVEDRYVTLTDIIERALKKGKPNEQISASNLSGLLAVQLGGSTSSEEVYKTLKPIFTQHLTDASANPKTRAAIAHALGLICFIDSGEMDEILSVMGLMEKIFAGSYKEKPDTNADILALHTACISSWSLLMTLVPSSQAFKMLESHMEDLGSLLDSPDVDLRIAAGEAIVVLFENAVEHDEDQTYDSVYDLIPKLKDLATDSNKHRSKKDRKEQRSSFRDIVKYIEESYDYNEKLLINTRETLVLDSWFKKKHYDTLCKVLTSGINLHLTENDLVRDVFDLGSPVTDYSDLGSNKPSKHQRQLVNNQAFKFRTQTRGRERDKRTAMH